MAGKNKYGFDPIETEVVAPRKKRNIGPMGAAVREAAGSLQESTEAKTEQRRQNASDAKAFREAQEDGRVLQRIRTSEISTDDLPRDRLELGQVALSDEMEELKASIRDRGQKEPIEVYLDRDGNYQLKKGWRRLTALQQLHEQTRDDRFLEVLARVEQGAHDRMDRYVDMVEENVVREDLTFAEMAQVVWRAKLDPQVEETDSDALINSLYGSLHKMKRSYIRSFFYLQMIYGDRLKWPKAISRNLGVAVAREIKAGTNTDVLEKALDKAESADEQNAALTAFVETARSVGTATEQGIAPAVIKPASAAKEKFEFHVDDMKITARQGECRIVGPEDFSALTRDQLERAVRAFKEAIEKG